MYHSITFGDKNTWEDWHIVPSKRPLFNPPAQKVKTLDVPGGDGLLDLSESLTGYPVFQNRTGSIEFIVMNDYRPWQEAYSDIMAYLHGRTMRAILEDDPEYFYVGRFTVNSWKSEKDWSKITIDYSVNPYKWYYILSTTDWLWDPFSFKNGVIRPAVFKDIPVTETVYERIVPSDFFGLAPVCPEFIVDTHPGEGVDLRFVNPALGIDETHWLDEGRTQLPELVFYGKNDIYLHLRARNGTGTVSVEFREGRL